VSRLTLAELLTAGPAPSGRAAPAPASLRRRTHRYTASLATILNGARDLGYGTSATSSVKPPAVHATTGFPWPRDISRRDVEARLGRSPGHANAWWNSLTAEQQEQAIYDHPDLIGRLEGVPAGDRDTANRIALDRHRQGLRTRENQINARLAVLVGGPAGTGGERREIGELRDELAELGARRATVDTIGAALVGLGTRGLLLSFDPAGDGTAIVAVGDPMTAHGSRT
jgi:hypothetical protein